MSLYFTAQELKERIDSNDNRCTAKPYLLLLQESVEVVVPEDMVHDGDCWVETVSGDYLRFENEEEVKQWLKENDYKCLKSNYQHYFYRELHETQNVFLTDKGYQDHLNVNSHNLRKHRTYGIHAWRNKEIASLYNLIDECLKLQHQLEIQTKRVENLKKSNEFYAERKSWRYSGNDRFDCNISYLDASDVITGKQRDRVGGKLARSCQAIDQELEKQLEEVK